jgi:thiol-disulfide isomerase/thioredoxin
MAAPVMPGLLRRLRPAAGRYLDRALWVVVLGVLAWRLGPQLLAATGMAAGKEAAPAFELTTLDGRRIASDSLAGKVVLVNFWATWCAPCRLEMPGLERVWRARRDEGFVIVGVATDRSGPAGVREFAAERGVTYPIAMATAEMVRAFGGYPGLPTSYLIDRDGRVRHRIVGFYSEPALRAAVSRLLAAPARPSGR